MDKYQTSDRTSQRRMDKSFVLRYRADFKRDDGIDPSRVIVDLEDVKSDKIFRFTSLEDSFAKIKSLINIGLTLNKPTPSNDLKGRNDD